MGPTLAEEPAYAATAPIGENGQMAALLLSTPDGSHVVALSEQEVTSKAYRVWQGADLSPAGLYPEDVLAGMYVDHKDVRRYLLFVPEDTHQAQVSGYTAEANNQLAVVDVPIGEANDQAMAWALDADRSVIRGIRPQAFSGGPYEKEPNYLEIGGTHRDGIVIP